MDRKSVNGVQVTVNWAGPKPSAGSKRSNMDNGETPASELSAYGIRREVLTTTNSERDDAKSAGRGSQQPPRERSSRSRSRRRGGGSGYSRGDRRGRSRSRRRGRSRS
mmetsp:Transcript_23640/g.35459  ORF Transcript_23640/g.35459 Transcript_23640/m.35459 type:complete len:108 (+) Transcript_23640:1-324(+)